MIRQLALCVCFLASPVVAGANEDLGLWDVGLAMAETGSGENVSRMDLIRQTLSGFANQLEVDEESLDLLRKIRDSTLQLNLTKLYDVLPERAEGETRRLRAHGVSHGEDGYTYTLFPFRWGGDGTLGSLDTSTGMTPVEQDFGKGAGFVVAQEGRVGMGPIGHRHIARAAEQVLVSLERAAKGGISEVALAPARRLQPSLSATVDLTLLASVNASFPSVVRTMSTFLVVDRIGTVEEDMLVTDLQVRLNTDALKGAGFPDLGRYAARIGDLIRANLTLTDLQGQPLVTVKMASRDMSVRLSFVSKDGALIPRKDGLTKPLEGIRPTDRDVRLWLAMSCEFRAEGVLLRIYDYAVPIHYQSKEGGADIRVHITEVPKIDFTGTNKFTSFFAELADSALDLETHGQIVFRAVAAGTDGEGTRARMTFTDGSRGTLAMSTEVLLVDNPLIGFGLKIVGNQLSPKDAVVKDAMELLRHALHALESDYLNIRDNLVAVDGA
jgi:hypothetical protein